MAKDRPGGDAPSIAELVADVAMAGSYRAESDDGYGTAMLVGWPAGGGQAFITAGHVAGKHLTVELRHRLGDAGDLTVCLRGFVVAKPSKPDVCLVLACGPCPTFTGAVVLSCAPLRVGQPVYHAGGAYGLGVAFFAAIVSRLDVDIEGQNHSQLSAFATRGCSGGGVFDARGCVVGMVDRAKPGELSWMIPAASIAEWLDESRAVP